MGLHLRFRVLIFIANFFREDFKEYRREAFNRRNHKREITHNDSENGYHSRHTAKLSSYCNDTGPRDITNKVIKKYKI